MIPAKYNVDFSVYQRNFAARAQARLLQQFQGKLVLTQVVAAFASVKQQLYDTALAVLTSRAIANASGAQLAALGRILGQAPTFIPETQPAPFLKWDDYSVSPPTDVVVAKAHVTSIDEVYPDSNPGYYDIKLTFDDTAGAVAAALADGGWNGVTQLASLQPGTFNIGDMPLGFGNSSMGGGGSGLWTGTAGGQPVPAMLTYMQEVVVDGDGHTQIHLIFFPCDNGTFANNFAAGLVGQEVCICTIQTVFRAGSTTWDRGWWGLGVEYLSTARPPTDPEFASQVLARMHLNMNRFSSIPEIQAAILDVFGINVSFTGQPLSADNFTWDINLAGYWWDSGTWFAFAPSTLESYLVVPGNTPAATVYLIQQFLANTRVDAQPFIAWPVTFALAGVIYK